MAVPEIMEHAVPMALEHLGMDVEARVPELSNLLGKEFYSVDRIAENNRLVDAQLQRHNKLI